MKRREPPKHLGAWSIYPATDHHVVLLQSRSNVQGQLAQAELDVICRNALDPGAAILVKRIVVNWRGSHHPRCLQL